MINVNNTFDLRDKSGADTQRTIQERIMAKPLLGLPNLFVRSASTIILLYALLSFVLFGLVAFGFLEPGSAIALGIGLGLLQFCLGPYLMDLTLRWGYTMRWMEADELTPAIRNSVERICAESHLKVPVFGLIDDGGPQAFTYGHHPSNARVVISKGLLELLTPEEAVAVIAHELGHVRNWDMALMTLVHMVPLMLFAIYQMLLSMSDSDGKKKRLGLLPALGVYFLYQLSHTIILWFSRTREFYADRFAGEVTKNPNALASALVKIAYGLSAHQATVNEKRRISTEESALAAFNIYAESQATSFFLPNNSATSENGDKCQIPNLERVKNAMQWDLWNPWATYYELRSTHPLIAKRLLHLSNHSEYLRQEPFVRFDRTQPESYWDEFLIDLVILLLPWLGLIGGWIIAFAIWLRTDLSTPPTELGLIGLGLGIILKSRFRYARIEFQNSVVAELLEYVKVSPVRPICVTLKGQLIGKGNPGSIISEDFVLQDETGIIRLDYRQPLAIWEWLFGYFSADQYIHRTISVSGWLRRAPSPYVEIDRLEVVDGDGSLLRCHASRIAPIWGAFWIVLGSGLLLLALV